jgi:hypothetical protein
MTKLPTPWGRPQVTDHVRLLVRPQPTSTIYSSEIANKLKSFGEVTHFQAAIETEDSVVYRVAFESIDAAEHASQASPFDVKAFHNLESPRSLDPFNVFGYQQRKQPQSQTFHCEVKIAPAGAMDNSSKDRRLVTDERTAALYTSLLEAGAPMNMLEGLSTTIETTAGMGKISLTASAKEKTPTLYDMYLKGQKKEPCTEPRPRIQKYSSGRRPGPRK